MLNTHQAQVSQPAKRVWLINGTCGGCKSFEVAPNQTELANVKCSNEKSKFHGTAPGVLAINACENYEKKAVAPEGFQLV